jgi:hypothetical protein
MPNKNGKSLANRLAARANRQHEERLWQKNRRSWNPTLAHIKTHKEYNEWITTPAGQNYLNPKAANEPVYQNMTKKNNVKKANKKNCGPKPSQFIGTKKNPAFANWKACNAASAAGGGKRKTRKSKKSKRMTRRR